MIKQLIYKEFKLVINPYTFLFLLLAALMLIPSYPYIVAIFYFFMIIQVNYGLMKENKDIEFTLNLPVKRNDIILSKVFSLAFIELLQLLAAVPFALIGSLWLNKGGNPAGMDANFAFFGYVLIAYSAYNLFFLPGFFKTGYKIGVPLISGLAGFLLVYFLLEIITAFIPALKNNLDSLAAEGTVYRILVLVFGMAVYAASLYAAYKRSVKLFDKVSL